jgi:hypothetical protein
MREYSSEEDDAILNMKGMGFTYADIGTFIERTPSSVRSRWRKLQKRRSLRYRCSRRVPIKSVFRNVTNTIRRLLHGISG